MFVKMLEGRYAGQVRDLRNDIALDMLALNRVEQAFQEPAPLVLTPPPPRGDEGRAEGGESAGKGKKAKK